MLNGEQREGLTLKTFSLRMDVSVVYDGAIRYMPQWHRIIYCNSVRNFRDRKKDFFFLKSSLVILAVGLGAWTWQDVTVSFLLDLLFYPRPACGYTVLI